MSHIACKHGKFREPAYNACNRALIMCHLALSTSPSYSHIDGKVSLSKNAARLYHFWNARVDNDGLKQKAILRKHEAEANKSAYEAMIRAGYDYKGAYRYNKRWPSCTKPNANPDLDTHPTVNYLP